MTKAERVLFVISILCIFHPIAFGLYNWARFLWKLGTAHMLAIKNRFIKDPVQRQKNWDKSLDILEKMMLEIKAAKSKQ